MANKPLKSIKFPGLSDTYTVPEVDDTLAVTGAAADAKKVGDEISDIKEDLSDLEPGLSDDAKTALLSCFQHVVWVDSHGQDYYDALEAALYAGSYPKITAVFNAGANIIYTDDALDTLKQYLTVKYFATKESTGTVIASSDYTLSGVLTEGTSTITVTYDEVRTSVSIPCVVDFYNQWSWTSAETGPNKLEMIIGGLTTLNAQKTGYDDIIYSSDDNSKNTRRGFAVLKGNKSQIYHRTIKEYGPYYPIPVPDNAVKVTAEVTPSSQFVATYCFTATNMSDSKYHLINQSDIAWVQGSQTIVFEATQEKRYIVVAGKYNQGSSTYETNPTVSIQFE